VDKLAYDFVRTQRAHREGSFGTRAARRASLRQVAEQLRAGGYRHLRLSRIKPKHVAHLVSRWQREGLATGTIKNRLAHLRWAAGKAGRANIVPSNAALDTGMRTLVATPETSRAAQLPPGLSDHVANERTRAALVLQEQFGLRREEALKLQPSYADRGTQLVLRGAWTKGGRPRAIPIGTLQQRAALDQAARLAGGGSLIPAEKTYRQARDSHEKATQRAGIDGHGLRHAYAQTRFRELAGFPCPAAGGPTHDQLTATQRVDDRQARLQLAEELGHGRGAITSAYLGR
jgi:site-specific recombinase XerD